MYRIQHDNMLSTIIFKNNIASANRDKVIRRITFSKCYEKSKYNGMILNQHDYAIYAGEYLILRLSKIDLIDLHNKSIYESNIQIHD